MTEWFVRILLSLSFSMPLLDDARVLIRANLEALQRGERVSLVAIGKLAGAQLEAINRRRCAKGYLPIEAEVVFLGRHVYESRALGDGYQIEDIIDQISSAMDAASVVPPSRGMTVVENPRPRADRYGNLVRDRIILECSARYPRPELFSVIPKGDMNKPNKRPLASRERPDPQRLARVTSASGAPAAADSSMTPVTSTVNDVVAGSKE